jgi:AraC-like DNA-binding protein
MPVEIMERSSSNADAAHELVTEVYGGVAPLRISGDPRTFACSVLLANAGSLGSDLVRISMSAETTSAPLEFFTALCLTGGRFDVTIGADEQRLGRGDVACYRRDEEIDTAWANADLMTLRVSFPVVDRIARERFDHHERVRFHSIQPVSPAAQRGWGALTHFVLREITRSDSMLDNPLIEAQMTDLVAATALASFSNSTLSAAGNGRRGTTAPASLRRAMAYIEANAQSPISITDIADAANVTPRALQYGFARHLDSSPMRYLRRVRMDRARQELRESDPTRGATVAEISRRWGFATPGRFAADYRVAYGESPSRTLAR